MECGCGRSPTGKCIGWHSLSEDEFKKKLETYKRTKSKKLPVSSRPDLAVTGGVAGSVAMAPVPASKRTYTCLRAVISAAMSRNNAAGNP